MKAKLFQKNKEYEMQFQKLDSGLKQYRNDKLLFTSLCFNVYTFFLFAFCLLTSVSAQNFNQAEKIEEILPTQGVFVESPDDNKSYGTYWPNVALFMFNYDRVMNGTMTFEKAIQLAVLSSSTTANGFWIDETTGRIANNWNGSPKLYATVQDLADSGRTNDTIYFAHLLLENDFALNQNFNGGLTVSGDADFSNADEIILKSEATLPTIDGANRIFVYNDRPYFTNSNHSNIGLALYSEVGSGAFLPISGTLTGISSTLSWSSGGQTIGKSGKFVLSPQNQGSTPTWFNGRIFTRAGTDAQRIYFQYEDQDYNELTSYAPGINEVNEAINDGLAATLNSIAPEEHSDLADTLDWSNKNYLAGIYGANGAQTVTVTNYTYGWVSFGVESQEAVTITIPSVTIDWGIGGEPDFSNGERIEVTLKYWSATVAKGSYTW